ncbi:hypothetical protein POM88_021770 [Heracleum sosnowskyi]|uniref:TF-B3 domain-containing protein n=1 Tax=Heracleum sosnowskyi TaxID=360622 RepID=A0AAD8IE25_9APIA|nr:hypothetical protein POM88_021770 [Heracleum sosnowskyi]
MAHQNEMAPAMQSDTTSSSRKRKADQTLIPEALPVGEVNMGQFLFDKKLTHSDVKGQNRMIIPKAYAEKFFAEFAKLGSSSQIFMDDIRTGKVWKFCFRSWQNGGSRMYVLEGIGKYTQAQNIKVGDFILLYKDDQTDRYQISWRNKAEEEHHHSGDGVEKEELPAASSQVDLPPASSQVDCVGNNEVQSATSVEVASADEYHPQFLTHDEETSQFVQTTDIVDPEYVTKNFNITWDEFLNYNPFDD